MSTNLPPDPQPVRALRGLAREATAAVLVVAIAVAYWPLLGAPARAASGPSGPYSADEFTELELELATGRDSPPRVDSAWGAALGSTERLSAAMSRLENALFARSSYYPDLALLLASALLVARLGATLAGTWTFGLSVGILYALHPARLAQVGDLDGRGGAFAACAVLGALAAHAQAGAAGRVAWRGVALACVALAAIERPAAAAVVGPLWWVWDRWHRPLAPAPRALAPLAFAMAALALAFECGGGARLAAGPLAFGPVLERAIRPDGFPLVLGASALAWSPSTFLALAVVLAAIALLARYGRRTSCANARLGLYGAAWALLAWAAERGLATDASAYGDGRELAPALGGLAFVLASGVARASGRRAAWLVPGVAVALSMGLGVYTHRHARAFASPIGVYEAALARDGGRNYRADVGQALHHWWACAEEFDIGRTRVNLTQSLAALDHARPHEHLAGPVSERVLGAMQRARTYLAQAGLVPEGFGAPDEIERLLGLAMLELESEGALSSGAEAPVLTELTDEARRREALRLVLIGETWVQRAAAGGASAAAARIQARSAFEAARVFDESAVVLIELATLELAGLDAALAGIDPSPAPGPWACRTWVHLAWIRQRAARVTAAEALLDLALLRRPSATDALTQKALLAYNERRGVAPALELLARALAGAGSPRARMEVHRQVARLRMVQGELGLAEQEWESVLATDGHDLEALRSLSDICAAGRQWHKALNYLRQLITHHKLSRREEVAAARARLSELHRELGNYLYRQTLEVIKGRRKPASAEPVGEDEILASVQDPEIQARMIEATDQYAKALEANPDDVPTRQRMAAMHFLDARSELVAGNLNKALKDLVYIVRFYPEFETASQQIMAIAQVMEQQGRLEEIYKILDEEHQANPMSVLLRNLRGAVKLKLELISKEPELVRHAQSQIDAGTADYKHYWVVSKNAAEHGAHEAAFAHGTTAILLCPETKQRDQLRRELAGLLIRWGKTAHGALHVETDGERSLAALAAHPPWWIPARVFRAAFQRRYAGKLAVVALQLGRAHDLLRPLYDADPTNSELANNLALVYQLTNQPDRAIEVLDTVERKPPHVIQLLAELLFKRAVLGGDEESTEGRSLERQINALAQQVADLERALELLGDAAPDKYAKALTGRRFSLDRARGVAAESAGRFEEAVAHLERARGANELDFVTNYHLGLALVKVGRNGDAAARLELARARRPKDVGVLLALSDLYFQAGGADYARAFRIYGQFLDEMSTAGESVTALYADTIARARERQEELIGRYRRHYETGTAHIEARRYREGAEELARALDIRPEATDVRHQRALALLALPEAAGAKAELLRVRREWPDDPFVPWRLARAHALLGEVAPARALLEAVVANPAASAELVRAARTDLDGLPK